MEMLRLTGNLAVKTFGIGLVVAGLIISATMLFEHNEVQTAGPAIQESIDNYIDKTEITLQKEKINTVLNKLDLI